MIMPEEKGAFSASLKPNLCIAASSSKLHTVAMADAGLDLVQDPEALSKKTDLRIKFFYGLGAAGQGTSEAVFSYFLLRFYNSVCGMDSVLVGSVVMISLMIDAFTDPLMGIISDNCTFGRSLFGKRHMWMYLAIIPCTILNWALWNPPIDITLDRPWPPMGAGGLPTESPGPNGTTV